MADDAGEVALSPLQLNDGRFCAVQQGVAVAKSGSHDTARHCLRHLVGQQTAYVTKAEDTRGGKPAPIFGVENRNRLSERVSCENDSDFLLRKSAAVFDSD